MPVAPAPQVKPPLLAIVAEHFRRRAPDLGLDPVTLRVDSVLNPGGFTNPSFHIDDGHHTYHLKLTQAPHRVNRLRRWHALGETLHARYRAPRILEWVDIPGAGCYGLLFAHLPGRTPRLSRSPTLLAHVFALITRLHRDDALARELRPLLAAHGEPVPATYRESFVDTYIDRFREELRSFEAGLPPFVSAETLAWMRDETEALAAAATAAPFAAPTAAPIHGDLNEHNVLVSTPRRWHVLDWDDLTLGDPALDYAMLLWPVLCDRPLAPATAWRAALPESIAPPRDPDLDERLALYLRAQALDGVIDSLANYLEAPALPEHLDRTRTAARRLHLASLRRYRTLCGEPPA